MVGMEFDPRFVDPYDDYNFELDTLSAAKDVGTTRYSEQFPLDLLNRSRTGEDGPDLGAYERIEK
jgi:hypothetical protein